MVIGRVKSNSVCNHTSDNKIGRLRNGSPIVFHEYDYRLNNIHEKITRFWLAKSSAVQV